MKRSKIWLRLLAAAAAAVLMCCAGCDRPAGKIDFTQTQPQTTPAAAASSVQPLRIAFASVMSPKETRQSYQKFVSHISQELQKPAVLLQKRTYEELNKLMDNGGADIAFFSTGAYSAYRGKTPIELLAMTQTNESVLYQTYLIAASDSDITDFSQLQGRVFAFTDPLSYSGRQAIDFLLLDMNTSASAYFKSTFYTYKHDKSIWAVANHLADAASVDSQIYDFVNRRNPQLCEKVRVFAVLPAAPTGPVVMRSDLPDAEKAELRRIFYSMDQDPALREAMERTLIDKFVPPEPELYAALRHKYSIRNNVPGE